MTQYWAKLRVPADLGRALEQARRAKGLTQAQLAGELDMHQSAVSAMEAGDATAYARRFLEMARSLGLEITATWESGDAPSS